MEKGWWKAITVAVFAVAGCSGGSDKDTTGQPDAHDANVTDQAAPDLVQDLVPDVPAPDGVEPDGKLPDLAEDSKAPDGVTPDVPEPDGGPTDDFGFNIRIPENHSVTCSKYPDGFPKDPMEQADVDWICTFDYGDQHGHIYVQATPVDCQVFYGPIPIFECPAAYMSIDGKVEKLLNPVYNAGGNHLNDYIEFDWQGKHFKYYHSSFGFGFRACQPMDCIQVLDKAGGDSIEDGCKPKDRSLPAVCVQVGMDGTYPPLVDQFEPCNGDDKWK